MAARIICRCLQLGPAGELGRMILPCVQQCKGVRNGQSGRARPFRG
jgi:hypothetical protein